MSPVADIPTNAQNAPMGNYEWDGAPPTKAQRVIAGVFAIVLLVLMASSYFGWRIVGRYDGQATGCWVVVGLILFTRFIPTVRRSD
jgi:hypothetical protein